MRAYPVSEGFGDEGLLASINVIRPVSDHLTTKAFVDYGEAVLNQNTWSGWNSGNTGISNTYALAGVGVGADYSFNRYASATASIAVPLGNNPGRDINGLNSDSTPNRGFVWVGLNVNY